MITKEQLIDSMRHETGIIKHLAAKLPVGSLDYRPSEAQRSMEELMAYMTVMAVVPTIYSIDRNWERAEQLEHEWQDFTPERFPELMDRQMATIEAELAGLDEAAATTTDSKMPWGTPTTQAAGLMDMTLKCFVAYRMQFFLYVKACGVTDIGPANCWAGVDLPRKDNDADS